MCKPWFPSIACLDLGFESLDSPAVRYTKGAEAHDSLCNLKFCCCLIGGSSMQVQTGRFTYAC